MPDADHSILRDAVEDFSGDREDEILAGFPQRVFFQWCTDERASGVYDCAQYRFLSAETRTCHEHAVWLVCLSGVRCQFSITACAVLRCRAGAEIPQIAKVKDRLARRVAPFQAEEPVGAARLAALTQ